MTRLWLYWENRPGSEPPPHVLLCSRILRRVCLGCDIRLVTPENVRRYLPDYDPRLDWIRVVDRPGTEIAVRCDFIRAFLLERYGGLYVDTDCIALRDLAEIGDRLSEVEFVGMRRTTSRAGTSVSYFTPTSRPSLAASACSKAMFRRWAIAWV